MNRTLIIQYGARNKKLREMGFSSYKEYLASDYWKLIKEKWNERRKEKPEVWGRCHCCGSEENLLLHHYKYGKIKKIILSGFWPVCPSCHERIHRLSLSGARGLKSAAKVIAKNRI